MMRLSRRRMLAACAAAVPALRSLSARAEEPAKSRLGVVIHSYAVRSAAERSKEPAARITDPLVLLEHCHQIGAGGIQTMVGLRDADYIARLRAKLEAYQMFLEGSIRLPQDRADVARFDREVRTVKEAGAAVVRTVMLGGRRYETFDSAEAFRKWADRAYQSLTLAEPVVARQGVRLAVENHKDRRADELASLLKRLGSAHVGVCVDTGNNLALLEDPQTTVATLAPWAFAVHLKDMAVAECEDGFLLSEVPLGDGFLDLKKIVATLRRARPEVGFCLEMITRDPLRVPCLTAKYWQTLENLPGRELARTLELVRNHKPAKPLPQIKGLPAEEQIAVEEANVRKSLAYARRRLGL